MEGTGNSRPYIAIAVTFALVLGWLVGALDLALAFTAGAGLTMALAVVSRVGTPAIHLGAASAEPTAGWAEFHRELARARRFDRPFGIVRFMDINRGAMTDRQVRDRAGALARRTDRVWVDGGDLFMLLPESDASAIETAVARTRSRLGSVVDVAVTATFPANGITSGSLIACLYAGDTSPVAIGALGTVAQALSSVVASDPGEMAGGAK